MFAKRTNWDLTPNRLSEALAAHRAAGKPLLDLTVSNPTECGFSYDSKVILEALSSLAALRYEPNPRGLESARPSPSITRIGTRRFPSRIFSSRPVRARVTRMRFEPSAILVTVLILRRVIRCSIFWRKFRT
jgi:hypothetical protein